MSTDTQAVPAARRATAHEASSKARAERARRRAQWERARTAYMPLIAAWAASRVVVFGCAGLAQVLNWPRGWLAGFGRKPFALLDVWDGHWYQVIAGHGYLLVPHRQSDPAFFPLLPVLMRASHVLGIPYAVSGPLIANIAFVIALVAVYELGRSFLPESDARRAAIYLALFPVGFVFSMAYPESLALAAIALAGLSALRGRWRSCAVACALATLARPEGALVILPIAAVVYRGWSRRPPSERGRALVAILAAPVALCATCAYLWWTVGEPLAWSVAQHAWNRRFAFDGVYRAGVELWSAGRHPHNFWLIRDVSFCVLDLALLAFAYYRRLPLAWIVAGAAMLLLPLGSGSFNSDARFGLLSVPVYWSLAILGKRPCIHRTIVSFSAILLGAGVFTTLLRWP